MAHISSASINIRFARESSNFIRNDSDAVIIDLVGLMNSGYTVFADRLRFELPMLATWLDDDTSLPTVPLLKFKPLLREQFDMVLLVQALRQFRLMRDERQAHLLKRSDNRCEVRIGHIGVEDIGSGRIVLGMGGGRYQGRSNDDGIDAMKVSHDAANGRAVALAPRREAKQVSEGIM